jgi:uncharacterized iron-regulated membrane protein
MARTSLAYLFATGLLLALVTLATPFAAEAPAAKPSAEAEALAAKARAAGKTDAGAALDVLYAKLADRVQLDHVPKAASDGVYDAAAISKGGPAEVAAMRKLMADFKHELVKVAAKGDTVELSHRYTGTMPDGGNLNYTSHLTFVLSGGKFTTLVSQGEASEEQRARLQAAMKQGGFSPNAKKD